MKKRKKVESRGKERRVSRMGKEEEDKMDLLEQSQRNITLQSSLELNLDVQVQTKLQTDGLGVGQAGEDGGLREPPGAGLRELLVVSAAAAAAGVNGRGVRGRVVELWHDRVGSHFCGCGGCLVLVDGDVG